MGKCVYYITLVCIQTKQCCKTHLLEKPGAEHYCINNPKVTPILVWRSNKLTKCKIDLKQLLLLWPHLQVSDVSEIMIAEFSIFVCVRGFENQQFGPPLLGCFACLDWTFVPCPLFPFLSLSWVCFLLIKFGQGFITFCLIMISLTFGCSL